MVTIVASVVTGLLALLGVIITNSSSNKEIEHKIMTSQEVTNVKLENLTEEVKKHNEYIDKIPKMEVRIDNLEEKVKELKHQ